MAGIILFDGVCNLCNNSVKSIIQRDSAGYFQFASLQSDVGQKLLQHYGLNDYINSFVLIENERYYLKSSAALRICKNLDGAWKLLSFLRIIPRPIRDFIYDRIAHNRYKWFGKQDSCMIPTPEIRKRFLDES